MVLPGGTIGIIGGGQLGRMMILAARAMGYRSVVLDPNPQSPAAQVADHQVVADYADVEALTIMARQCDVVTYEFENVSVAALHHIIDQVPVRPNPQLLWVSQNRIREKEMCQRLGLPTAKFQAVTHRDQLTSALDYVGLPCVFKTAEGGYDGKGQVVVHNLQDAQNAWHELGSGSIPLIIERLVSFDREASVVIARGSDGDMRAFPVGENLHRHGILHMTSVPAALSQDVLDQLVAAAKRLAEGLELVGVMAIEFFVFEQQATVLVNELAPRPHNSGHYTIEACDTSQFEQHVRAITGMPLGPGQLLSPAAMVNVLGDDWPKDGAPNFYECLTVPGTHLHLYGKDQPRVGRKMGHITVLSPDAKHARDSAQMAWQRFSQN